jgi:hypothetical protein
MRVEEGPRVRPSRRGEGGESGEDVRGEGRRVGVIPCDVRADVGG